MKKSYFFYKIILVIVIFIVLGLGASYFIQKLVHKNFLGKIKLASEISLAAINPERIKNLAALLPEDISQNSDYLRVKNQIIKLGESFELDGIDAIYPLAMHSGAIYFLAESTPDGEPLAVPPGKIYMEAPPEVYETFTSHDAHYTEKYSDEFGDYISLFSPISNSGEQVGVLGVDVDHTHYQAVLVKILVIFWLIWLSLTVLILLILFYIRNVHKRKNDFKANEQRVKSISDSISDAVVVVDDEDKIVFWSKVTEKIFKLPAAEALGHKFSELVKPDMVLDIEADKEISDFEFSVNKYLVGKLFEFRLKRKEDESSEYYELSFSAADVDQERYLVGVFHDITFRMREEFTLQHQKSELEKLNSLMIGRELKMLELKKEINDLKAQISK